MCPQELGVYGRNGRRKRTVTLEEAYESSKIAGRVDFMVLDDVMDRYYV